MRGVYRDCLAELSGDDRANYNNGIKYDSSYTKYLILYIYMYVCVHTRTHTRTQTNTQ